MGFAFFVTGVTGEPGTESGSWATPGSGSQPGQDCMSPAVAVSLWLSIEISVNECGSFALLPEFLGLFLPPLLINASNSAESCLSYQTLTTLMSRSCS